MLLIEEKEGLEISPISTRTVLKKIWKWLAGKRYWRRGKGRKEKKEVKSDEGDR